MSRTASLLNWFRPDPPATVTESDPVRIQQGYERWQARILAASTAGYAIYYFVRVNLPIAMPALQASLRISYTQIGLLLTLHQVVYGISKFLNGFLGDRTNARTFMATGLLASAILNLAFGSSSHVAVLGGFWVLNGWFQGMGFPPCARLLTHWFPPRQLATKMSIWNTSHSIGAALVNVMCGYLVVVHWRLCFWVPGVIALVASVGLLFALRDTPESLGLPPVETLGDPQPGFEVIPHHGREPVTGPTPVEATLDYATPVPQSSASHLVFGNPYIWLVSVANFLVYTIRYAFLSWAPTFLTQAKGIRLTHAGWMTASFETAGLCGALIAGVLTDRYFGGRAVRAALISMSLAAGALFVFWRVPQQSELTCTALISAVGFFIYGPQCLIGIAAANLATRRAAATAVGLTGLFGYASSVLSGFGLGAVVQRFGWDRAFSLLMFVALAGVAVFALAWNAPADGYGRAGEDVGAPEIQNPKSKIQTRNAGRSP